MLVLSRKIRERILIGDDIIIEVLNIKGYGDVVKLGITAPRGTVILREELVVNPPPDKKEGAA